MNVQEIRDRWSKATRGKWDTFEGPFCMEIRSDNDIPCLAMVQDKNDAAAIASSPTDIAYLLAEVERLNRMVDKACERLELLSADDNYGYGKETWRKYLESEVADK